MAYTWQAEDSIEPISSSTIEAIANIGTYSVATGCTVSYGVGTMICTVASGNVVFSSVLQTVVGNTVTLVADASNPRWTWIAINSSGVAVMVAGTAAASPSVPELGNNVGIALVKVEASQTSANAIVYKLDKRVLSPASQRVATTTGDIVYASAAFTPARLGIGSSGQSLVVSGGLPVWATASVEAVDYQAFTGSGTWTKPAGATALSWTLIRVWGAGGSGGGGQGDSASNYRVQGGGGGAAACIEKWLQTNTLGATETITIGAGGTPGGTGGVSAAGGNGTAGGNSSFGSWGTGYGGGSGGGAISVGTSAFAATGGGGGGQMSVGGNGGSAYPTNNAGTGGNPTQVAWTGTTPTVVYGGGGGGRGGNSMAGALGALGGSSTNGGGGGGSSWGNANDLINGAGGMSVFGGGGGGAGGGVQTNNLYPNAVATAGGAAGVTAGGAAGATGGGAGPAGTTGIGTNAGGSGGGGGGGNAGGTGGVGGAGGAVGGGGGGGGGGTSTGGAGGVGGIGYMQVITIL